MQKLMTCATKCGTSRPNCVAISVAALANKTGDSIKSSSGKTGAEPCSPAPMSLTDGFDEQGVKDNRFRERHSQHCQHDDFAERAGVAANGFRRLHAHQAHADGRSETAQSD